MSKALQFATDLCRFQKFWEHAQEFQRLDALVKEQAQEIERLRAQRDGLMEAANEVLERIQCYPAYQELTIDEEIEIGGDTAEFSYLARVLSEAIEAAHEIHPLQRLADLSKEIGEKL